MTTKGTSERECRVESPTQGEAVTPPPGDALFDDSRLLVERLIAKDNAAWSFVIDSLAKPFFNSDARGIRAMCVRNGVSEDAVVSRLYHLLSRNGCRRLKSFRFECAFPTWLFWQLRDAAQGAVREVIRERELPKTDSAALALAIDDSAPTPAVAMARKESRDALNRALSALWRKKPLGALVFLLRGELDIPSKKVAPLIGKKPATVDQIYHRAQIALRDISGDLVECIPGAIRAKDALGMTDNAGSLAFASMPTAKAADRWLIEIDIPLNAAEPPRFAARLCCPKSRDGVFRLCGIGVAIRDGRGILPWDEFVAGIADGGISFERTGTATVPGVPVFSSLAYMM